MTLAELIHHRLAGLAGIAPILALLSAVGALFAPPLVLITAFIVSLGLQTFFLDVGVTLTLPRALAPLALLSLALHAPRRLVSAWERFPARAILLLYFLLLAASVAVNLPFLPEKEFGTTLAPVEDAFFRGNAGRGAVQWLILALRAATPLLILAAVTTRARGIRLLSWLIGTTTAACLYGIYQIIAFSHALPAIYIYRGFNDPTGAYPGAFGIAGDAIPLGKTIFRVSSLLGEPRDLAMFLLPVVAFLGVYGLLSLRQVRRKTQGSRGTILAALFILHAATVVLTFSTSGWLAFLLALPVVLLVLSRAAPSARVAASLIALLAIGVLAAFSVPATREILRVRLVERVGRDLLTDRTYGVPQLLETFRTYPHTIAVGTSPGGILLYGQSQTTEASSIRFLADGGVIGLALFLLFLFQTVRETSRTVLWERSRAQPKDPVRVAVTAALLTSIASLLTSVSGETLFALWVWIGLAAAFSCLEGPRGSRPPWRPREEVY